MLSTDDADLYDYDVNGELRLVPTIVPYERNNEFSHYRHTDILTMNMVSEYNPFVMTWAMMLNLNKNKNVTETDS